MARTRQDKIIPLPCTPALHAAVKEAAKKHGGMSRMIWTAIRKTYPELADVILDER